ncbi:MAG: DNA-processing protein DprA [Clostridia bacterium]|nr:DNA-processing protein DprA [Clostridia bacterium]
MKHTYILFALAKLTWKKQFDILQEYGSSDRVFEQAKDGVNFKNLTSEENEAIQEILNTNMIETHIKGLEKLNIKIICIEDEEYPENLKNIYDPPMMLYCKGDISLLKEDCLAVVGARVGTRYGMEQTTKFAKDFSKAGFCVVSGLAEGTDGHAHRAVLEVEGKTIAVMAGGLNTVYPAIHTELFEQIANKGLLISENLPNYKPKGYNFIQRNRIIAGLSLGVFVPEASTKSGSLHTVEFAIENGREVFALPGPVDSRASSGTNHLIKNLQAHCATEPKDVISRFPNHKLKQEKVTKQVVQLNMYEQLVINCVANQDTHFDEIAKKTQMDTKSLNSLLTTLSIRGLIKRLSGNYFRGVDK